MVLCGWQVLGVRWIRLASFWRKTSWLLKSSIVDTTPLHGGRCVSSFVWSCVDDLGVCRAAVREQVGRTVLYISHWLSVYHVPVHVLPNGCKCGRCRRPCHQAMHKPCVSGSPQELRMSTRSASCSLMQSRNFDSTKPNIVLSLCLSTV